MNPPPDSEILPAGVENPHSTQIPLPPFRLPDDLLLASVFLIPFLSSSLYYRPFTEIKWIALYAIAFGVLLYAVVRGKRVEIPRVTPAFWWGVFLILLNQAGVQLARSLPLMNDYWVDRIGFLVFLVAAFNLQARDALFYRRLIRAAVLSAAAFTAWFLFTLAFESPSPKALALSMGQINMAAQFLSFSLPFVFVGALEARSGRVSVFLGALLVLVYVAIYFTGCRSCWIGSIGALVYFAWVRRIFSLKRIGIMAASVAALVLSSRALSPAKPSQATQYLSEKTRTYSRLTGTTGREGVWRGTRRMILDHPFGIGPDQFELGFLQYDAQIIEDRVWPAPHDEFLRILGEEGWIGLLLFALSAGTLLALLFRGAPRQGGARALLVATLIVWFPELLVQFPLGMANSVLPLALVLGTVCAMSSPGAIRLSRAVPLCALALVAAIGGAHAALRTLEREYPSDRGWADLACRLDPSYWQACVSAIRLDEAEGYSERAHRIVERTLKSYPDHYPTLRAAGDIAFLEGDRKSGCEYLARYDSLFRGESSVHPQLQKLCGN